MNTEQSRLVQRVAVWVIAAYAIMVLFTLAFNAWWRACLGIEFAGDTILECVYGPAITLASSLLLWLVIWGQLVLLTTRRS